jgi:biotin carboxyl carrier protein
VKNFKFTINGNEYNVDINSFEGNKVSLEVNGTSYSVELNKEVKVTKTPVLVQVEAPKPTVKETKIPKTQTKTTNTAVKSPLPGVILKVMVKEGDSVTMGQTILTMEAMKMENNVLAEKDGIITSIKVKQGDSVLQNDILAEIE